jgi:phospholipase C
VAPKGRLRWYDHVPPTIEAYPQGGYQLGFRVPLIVVSAYTPAGFISDTPEDFGSVIRFVERNFGIVEGALTFADLRSTGDLTEFSPYAIRRASSRRSRLRCPRDTS